VSKLAASRVAATTGQVTATPTWMLQRSCACGRHSAAGECHACQKERENPFQRAAITASPGSLDSPPDVPRADVSRSRLDRHTQYDLSRVSATTLSLLRSPRLQRQLIVNAPGDVYEQEADRVAHRVMRMADSSPAIRHRVEPEAQRICKACEEERVQRQAADEKDDEEEAAAVQASPDAPRASHEPPASSTIRPSELTTGGAPLTDALRTYYEDRLGYDLGSVRVHTGADAERMNDDLHARAFTYGNHIWFGSTERPQPSFCLAHELVHVVQQSSPRRVGGDGALDGSPARAELQASPAPAGVIQRVGDLYWVGQDFYARKGNTGKEIQDEIYASRAGASDVSEEVRIPNAARKRNSEESEFGLHVKSGFADLYRADKQYQIGVYFDEKHVPHRLAVKKGLTARPVVDDGVLVGTDDGPTWVRIGEIKPATAGMIRSGKQQVANYLEGIKLAGRETNAWAGRNNTDPWPLDASKVEAMSASDFTPHQDHTPGSATGTLYDLVLVEWSAEARKPKVVLNPQRALRARVEGRMHVNSFGGGVWAYHFEPTNLAALLADPARQGRLTGAQTRAIDFAQALQNSVVDPITGAPVQAMMTLRRSDARPPAAGVRQTPQPRIQRARKEAPRLRDTFSLEQVVAARGQLAKRFGKEKDTEPFQELQGIGLMYEADATMKKLGITVRDTLPDESQLFITLKTQSGGKSTGKGGAKASGTTTQPLSTLFQWFEVWTHPAINTLAKIRKVFGSTFVTVGTKIRTLKDRIGTKLSQTFEQHAGGRSQGTSYGAVALRAIARALKSIGAIIIPQTLRIVVQSLIDGVKAKLKALIPLDVASLGRAVADDFAEFKVIQEKLASLEQTVESEVTTVIEGLGARFSGIKDLISLASTVATTVKWTVRAIQCGTPPGWGCLKLVFSSLTAYIAEKVLSTCSLQRDVACLTADLEFVKTGIPKALAGAITEHFNGVVGKIDPRLSPLFAEITEVPSLDCTEVGCEGGRTEMDLAFARLQLELERKHGVFAAAWLMDSLFEMSRLSGKEEGDMLSAAEVDELTNLLLKHNVSPAELQMIVLQMRQQVEEGKPLLKVTPQELMNEIERQRQLMLGTEPPATEGTGTSDMPSPDSGGPGGAQAPGGGGTTTTTTTGGETEAGEGEGLSTVDAARAKFDGKITSPLNRTRIVVENPDPTAHKAGKNRKVALIGKIDGKPVKRVSRVPVTIGPHVRDEDGVTIPYVLKQGVCFKHSVADVPMFCLDNGTTIEMPVKKAQKKKRPERK
jgi:hypothetical protein